MIARSTSIKVWRYMNFSRFVWMLKAKALWMCRTDRLRDAWEMALSRAEEASIIKSVTVAGSDVQETRRVFKKWITAARERTYVRELLDGFTR